MAACDSEDNLLLQASIEYEKEHSSDELFDNILDSVLLEASQLYERAVTTLAHLDSRFAAPITDSELGVIAIPRNTTKQTIICSH